MNTIPRPRPLDAERAAHARRRHDGVCGVRPGAGAYGAGGEDDEGVEGFSSFLLDEKGTKNQGRHHRTHRTKRALPRPSLRTCSAIGHGPRTQPDLG